MKVEELLNSRFVDDDTKIFISDFRDFRPFTSGKRYEDSILGCVEREITLFAWHEDNSIDVYVRS